MCLNNLNPHSWHSSCFWWICESPKCICSNMGGSKSIRVHLLYIDRSTPKWEVSYHIDDSDAHACVHLFSAGAHVRLMNICTIQSIPPGITTLLGNSQIPLYMHVSTIIYSNVSSSRGYVYFLWMEWNVRRQCARRAATV